MKTTTLVLSFFLLTACAATPEQYQAMTREINAARDPASDGGTSITNAETERIAEVTPKPPFDWTQLALPALQIGLAILGVKVLPGSVLNGPWDKKKPPTA